MIIVDVQVGGPDFRIPCDGILRGNLFNKAEVMLDYKNSRMIIIVSVITKILFYDTKNNNEEQECAENYFIGEILIKNLVLPSNAEINNR